MSPKFVAYFKGCHSKRLLYPLITTAVINIHDLMVIYLIDYNKQTQTLRMSLLFISHIVLLKYNPKCKT